MDHVATDKRSAIMAAVKPTGSGPEMQLRRMLHAAGYRYALHRADLPGKPDLVFSSRRKASSYTGAFGTVTDAASQPVPRRTRCSGKRSLPRIGPVIVAISVRSQSWGGSALSFGSAS